MFKGKTGTFMNVIYLLKGRSVSLNSGLKVSV